MSSGYKPVLSDTAYNVCTLSDQNLAELSKFKFIHPSIPSIFLAAYPARVKGMLEHIPVATGQEAGYILGPSQKAGQPPIPMANLKPAVNLWEETG